MLKNKVVLISGATSGMGKAFLEKFATQGAAVIFNGLPSKTETIQDLQADLKRRFPGQIFYHNANMRIPDEIRNMVEEGVKTFGKIDILLNNAGVSANPAPLYQTPLEEITKTIEVNLMSHIYMSHAVIPIMIKNQWGRIINTASIGAKVALAGGSAYCASKHALVGLTKSWALELAEQNITVNAICPGFVNTPLMTDIHPDPIIVKQIVESIIKQIPTRKIIQPEEVSELVFFLCGETAKNITGATFDIDGGYTAQ